MNYLEVDSKIINIRLTEEKDLAYVIEAENAPLNAPFVSQWSKEQHLQAIIDEDIMHLIVEDRIKGEAIGYAIIAGILDKNKAIELRRIVISQKARGFGREALRKIKKLAFTQWGGHRLWLDVREKNTAAQYLYKSEGFIEEGLIRECIFNNGIFESLYIMAILRQEYSEA